MNEKPRGSRGWGIFLDLISDSMVARRTSEGLTQQTRRERQEVLKQQQPRDTAGIGGMAEEALEEENFFFDKAHLISWSI